MEEKDKKQGVIRIEDLVVEEYRDYDLPMPPEGKMWQHKSNGFFSYSGVYFGSTIIKNGRALKTPIPETADDYELIDMPEDQV